jgi:hypothetical protein
MTALPPQPPARLAGYDLAPPTESDVEAMLRRVFGPDRAVAIWADARRAAGFAVRPVHTADELQQVASALAAAGGAATTVARSIEIRLRTYSRLAARSTAPSIASSRAST